MTVLAIIWALSGPVSRNNRVGFKIFTSSAKGAPRKNTVGGLLRGLHAQMKSVVLDRLQPHVIIIFVRRLQISVNFVIGLAFNVSWRAKAWD